MAGAGLRREEAAGAHVGAYDEQMRMLRVIGKGDKERAIPLNQGTCSAVLDWLEHRGTEDGPILYAVTSGGSVTDKGITGDALLRLCQRLAKRSGVQPFSPHDLRRTYASRLLDAGADVLATQRLMGHASVVTTARYDRRDERAGRDAAELVALPYQSASKRVAKGHLRLV